MIEVALIEHCAPHVAVETIERIIAVESAGEIFAINVNGFGSLHAESQEDAVETAEALIDEGYSVDLGLMQINSRHLAHIGLTVKEAFEPCTNLKIGAEILQAAYQKAASVMGPGQRALKAAFSVYNTGDPLRGLANGYVSQIYAARVAATTALRPGLRHAARPMQALAAPTLVFSPKETRDASSSARPNTR